MIDECFGLKNADRYCYVLSNEGKSILHRKYGQYCNTMNCPFYKPSKKLMRKEKEVVEVKHDRTGIVRTKR